MVGSTHSQHGDLEVELKFELSRSDVLALCRSAPFQAMQSAAPTRQTLRATYFDTADLKLSSRGVSLRVRQEGRRYVQCVKAAVDDPVNAKACGAVAGGFARREWEWPVAGVDLVPALLKTDDALKPLFKGIHAKKLQPIFSTDIRRETRQLRTPDGACVTCDIDKGRIISGAREVPIFELELELISGPVGALLALARLVSDTVPARLSARTKAHRGYNVYLGKGSTWVHAEALALPKKPTAEDVLYTSVIEGLKHLIRNEDCVLTRSHIEGVHQMRIAMRRMRSVITAYKKLLPRGSYENLADSLKTVADALGAARDWDVFIDELLVVVEAGFTDAHELATLRTAAERHRTDAYKKADGLIRSDAYARLLTDVLYWADNQVWRGQKRGNRLGEPAVIVATDVLARRHAYLVKAGTGLKNLPIEQRHRLRIAVKKARYAAAFFEPLYASKKAHTYIHALRALQDGLGHLNDLANAQRQMVVLVETARGRKARDLAHAAGMLEGWYTHAQAMNEDKLLAAWKTFTKSKVFW